MIVIITLFWLIWIKNNSDSELFLIFYAFWKKLCLQTGHKIFIQSTTESLTNPLFVFIHLDVDLGLLDYEKKNNHNYFAKC